MLSGAPIGTRRPLPPLERLRAFEAAARLGSFAAAADALAVTPSAISHRIRALEAELGRPLFLRSGPSVALTEAGTALASTLGPALAELQSVWTRLAASGAPVLRVSSAPLFAARFILPGLAAFNAKTGKAGAGKAGAGTAGAGERRIDIECSHARARLEAMECDAAIRLAAAPDPAFACVPLLPVRAVAVASAGLVARLGPIGAALPGPLLAITHAREMWPEAARVWGRDLLADTPTLWFDSLETIIRRAEAGLGIALAPSALIADRLAAGALARLPGLPSVPGPTYWWMTRRSEARHSGLAAFLRWLRARLPAPDDAA